jgi:hypothetical protein
MEAGCLVDGTRRQRGPGEKTIERGKEMRGGIWRGDGGKEEVACAIQYQLDESRKSRDMRREVMGGMWSQTMLVEEFRE